MKNFWQDKVVIVTGASSGIGTSCVKEVAARGARVVMAARNEGRLRELSKDMPEGSALVVRTDVSQRDQVDGMIAQTVERFGRVDVLINNAAVGMKGSIISSPLDKYEQMMQTNVYGALYCIRAVYPHMKSQGGGSIVNVSSIAGLKGFYTCGLYASTKFALNGMTESLAESALQDHIHVALICPGKVETAFDNNLLYFEGTRSTEASGIEAVDVSRAILKAVEKKKRLVVIGKKCWPLYLLNRMSPALTNFLIRKFY
ncbi:MAG: SDR family NAD(P)-dependent oxidoreductase [Candidatus Omnitrophica bacterium]|nr:SDR family NAD(P)-dependent oxidoreductase [Candidatus Omnitrophota bacterium]